jgi:16S rRNA (guanine966-N2)-methyltransferase
MRVVGGFLKGKKIFYLKTENTRPLRDFVKESIFNVIYHSNLINVSLENANVLDLYSGVGSFGIESISRGAKEITFVENEKEALNTLKRNIEYLKIENKSTIVPNKIIRFLDRLNTKKIFQIFFFDPPFAENYFINELKIIKNSNIYSKDHLVVIHRDKSSKDNFSEILNVLLTKTYGRSKIIFGNFNLSTL